MAIHLIYNKNDDPFDPNMKIACGLKWDDIKNWSDVDCTEDESKVTCGNCIRCIKGEREYAGW